MPQSDLNLSDQPGASFRAEVNTHIQTLASDSAGASDPQPTYGAIAYQYWNDTTTKLKKQRNAANNGWVVRRSLEETFVETRSTNTALAASDTDKVILATGTFTQTINAANTLFDGWSVFYKNDGTGLITIDHNSSETIYGLPTLVLSPGESCCINCNATLFKTTARSNRNGIHGADIAAAATVNLDTATGDIVDITGNTGITAITLADGKQVTTRFTGAPTITNGASLICPGNANFTAAAGDIITWRGYASGVVRAVSCLKANGDLITSTPNSIASINGGQLAGFRNRIINGGMRCANYGTVTCVNGSYYGGAERWINVTAATSVTAGSVVAEAETTAASGYCQHINGLSTTGTTTVGIKTRLEDSSVADFNSKTVTVSGKAIQDTGGTLTLGIALQKANSLNNFGAITQIGSTQNVSIPTGVATVFSATFTLGSTDATNGLQIDALYNSITAVTNKNFRFEDMQIEIGSVATPFEMRPYALEELLCARYLPVFNNNNSNQPIASGICYSSTQARICYPFKVPARTTPTGITAQTAGNYGTYNNAATIIPATVIAFVNASTNSCNFDLTVASGLTAGNATTAMTNASNSKIIFTGAEL